MTTPPVHERLERIRRHITDVLYYGAGLTDGERASLDTAASLLSILADELGPATPARTPVVTLAVSVDGPDVDGAEPDDLHVAMQTRGVTPQQAAALLREALLNLDQKLWCEGHGVRTSLSRPAVVENG